jgi:hypothetical protein
MAVKLALTTVSEENIRIAKKVIQGFNQTSVFDPLLDIIRVLKLYFLSDWNNPASMNNQLIYHKSDLQREFGEEANTAGEGFRDGA